MAPHQPCSSERARALERTLEMLKRRSFLKGAGAATATALVSGHTIMAEIAGDKNDALRFASESMEVQIGRAHV